MDAHDDPLQSHLSFVGTLPLPASPPKRSAATCIGATSATAPPPRCRLYPYNAELTGLCIGRALRECSGGIRGFWWIQQAYSWVGRLIFTFSSMVDEVAGD
jgi:hypothetical protein